MELFDGEKLRYLQSFDSLAVAVSGGRDSMALLDYLAGDKRLKDKIFAVHVNHCLRGESSDADCELVKNYCNSLGIEVVTHVVDVNAFCDKYGYGTEQGARILRRRIFEDIIADGKAQRVITAHHLQDFCESVLMHVFRGSGIDGLCGIKFDDGILLRPLIDTDRKDVEEYVRTNGVPYRDDMTNFDTAYRRNYIRNKVMPAIEEAYPSCKKAIRELSLAAKETSDYLRSVCEKPLREKSYVYLPAEALSQPLPLATQSVFCALEQLCARVDCERSHIQSVLALKDKKSGTRVSLPHKTEVLRHGNKVYFYTVEQKDMSVQDYAEARFTVANTSFEIGDSEGKLRFDADKIPCGAQIRTRREGDYFKKFKGGTKSLGDYLTDEKVPAFLRDNIPLIVCGSEVLAVVGMQISDKIAVDGNTQNVRFVKTL